MGSKLEDTDTALEPPTLTVPAKRGRICQRATDTGSGIIIAALRAPVASDATAIGRRIYLAREFAAQAGRHTQRGRGGAEVPNLCQSVRRGAARPRAARRRSTLRICRPLPSFLPSLPSHPPPHRHRGSLPPTDTSAAPVCPADLAPDSGGGCGRAGRGAPGNVGRWEERRRSGAVGSGT